MRTCFAPFLLLAACTTAPGDTGETGDTDDSDTDDGTDTSGQEGDTTGPTLPACTPQAGDTDRIALSGVILLPDGPVAGHVVYAPSTGKITCAGAACDTAGATLVCTEGIVSPGLVDPHNHLQYNSMPPWQVDPEFIDRYDWQGDGRYDDFKDAYNAISGDYGCEIMQWAEAREIAHGTTSAVGSSGSGCIDRGVRNLDENSSASHLDSYTLSYSSGNVESSVSDGDGVSWRSKLDSGSTDAVMNHVAEGRSGSVSSEVDHMIDRGMTGPGQVYVHATDATTEQLAILGTSGTGIVWSPRSNLALYATTTPVEIATNLGVPWAIGSDWTPSGSIGQPQELACAETWLMGKGSPLSDVELWRKATEDAARLVGADGVLGVLVQGAAADIAVFDYQNTPYRAIIGADEKKVRLVIVDGEAVYGHAEYIDALAENAAWCDELDACGEVRKYCLKGAESGELGDTLTDVEATLEAALAGESVPAGYEYAAELFGLYSCIDERDVCDLREPSAGDDDGDGVADSADVCLGIYDPNQWDTDGDGLGDSCDRCPTVPGEDCDLSADDRDGDGIDNADDSCPDTYDDGTDTDGDGMADACDGCPSVPNQAGEGCPATVTALRQGGFEDGTTVQIEAVVVTAVRMDGGFFVQEPEATEYGGLYVFVGGAVSVEPGDVVSVTGIYTEYYGMSELTSPTVAVTGSASVPAPTDHDTCTLAGDPEPFEGMLVRVQDIVVTDANADADDGSDTPDYDEFVVDGCLRIDDFLDESLDQPPLDTALAWVQGVMLYSFDNPKLAPRSVDDIEAQ